MRANKLRYRPAGHVSTNMLSTTLAIAASALLMLSILSPVWGYSPPKDCYFSEELESQDQPCWKETQCGGCKNNGDLGDEDDYNFGHCQGTGPVRVYTGYTVSVCGTSASHPSDGWCRVAGIGTCYVEWQLCGQGPQQLLAKCAFIELGGAQTNEYYCKSDPLASSCRECDIAGAAGDSSNVQSYECFTTP